MTFAVYPFGRLDTRVNAAVVPMAIACRAIRSNEDTSDVTAHLFNCTVYELDRLVVNKPLNRDAPSSLCCLFNLTKCEGSHPRQLN
jgi:hypothetical protein